LADGSRNRDAFQDQAVDCVDPFVSIVTVSLNAATTIEDTIASVALQRTDFKFEHVAVDGGSRDGTREIIDHWAAHSDHIVRIYGPDTGIFDAMNKGLLAAKGEYVLYLNADDFLVAPDTLATALSDVSPGGHGNPDLILGDVVMGLCGSRGWWRHRRVPRLLRRLRGTGLIPLHQAQFTKRTLLQAAGGFDPNKKFSADAAQFYDLERTHRFTVRVVPRDVACMRPGGSANAGLKAIRLGTAEMYDHLKRTHGHTRAAGMVLVKTMQSLTEVRYGRCPHERWFASRTVER
jgi:glycosyltransferase involved in cell wall biosynthesis